LLWYLSPCAVQVRSQALALATFVNFASNFGVSLVLPTVQEVFGMQLTYATFAAVGVAAVANIYYNVPETKNKTLEQIEAIWRK
jgi:SP family xylose:H+ symportor-like MFS transporter